MLVGYDNAGGVQGNSARLDNATAGERDTRGTAVRAIADDRCAGVSSVHADLVCAPGERGESEKHGAARRTCRDGVARGGLDRFPTADSSQAGIACSSYRRVPRSPVGRRSASRDGNVTPFVESIDARTDQAASGVAIEREDDHAADIAVESRRRVKG